MALRYILPFHDLPVSDEVIDNNEILEAVDDQPPARDGSRGYRRVSEYMAWNPSTMIFPRFRAANALNLLCLQAEISEVHDQIVELTEQNDHEQHHIGDLQLVYSCNFAALKARDNGENKLWQKFLTLRSLLEKYNEAILRTAQMNQRPNPKSEHLADLQAWLWDPEGGNSELRGPGIPPGYWFSKREGQWNFDDNVSLFPAVDDEDRFRKSLFHSRLGSILLKRAQVSRFPFREAGSLGRNFELFKTGAFKKWADNIATVASCMITTVPIIALHFCSQARIRLVILVLFTFLFCGILTFMSTVKRSEVFFATAAFVALQAALINSHQSLQSLASVVLSIYNPVSHRLVRLVPFLCARAAKTSRA